MIFFTTCVGCVRAINDISTPIWKWCSKMWEIVPRPVARLKQLGGGGGQANWLNKATPSTPVSKKSDRLGSLRCNHRENIKKGVDLVSRTITLHLYHFLVHFFAVTVSGYLISRLKEDVKLTTTNFPFSFSMNLKWVVRIRPEENSPKIKKIIKIASWNYRDEV